jgi:hypothetical protein
MTVTVSPVFLLNVATGEPEAAELLDAITEKQLADWEGEWVPELLGALQRPHRAGVARAQWPQSRHWDWRRKAATLQGMLAYPGFSIVCGGVTQGMMLVDTTTKRCRIESQAGKNLIYVCFVENAPWNRRELFDPPRYRGIGSILIGTAVELSKEQEFKGRIGLHSLPQANAFYANTCGMTDLGSDSDPDYQGLRYFEMTPEQAAAFIAKGGKT